jgi:hypothetical protein
VTIEAAKFSKAQCNAGLTWKVIPNLGGSLGAVTAFPQGRPATSQADGVFSRISVRASRRLATPRSPSIYCRR